MTNKHCGLVAIVGRPNVGKSTLLNQILRQKVSITSKKPQTTRHRIMGIDTQGDYQAVYIDTPGLHIEEKRAINRLMNRAASSSLGDVEVVLFLVEAGRWTKDDDMVLSKLRKRNLKVVLLVNKIDKLQAKHEVLPYLQEVSAKYDFDEIIPISAEKRDNIEAITKLVKDSLPESEHYFPEDYVTDRSSRFMASEIIREKLMRFTGDELPYSTTVEIEQFKIQDNGVYKINGLILVERDGQKRMIIGNKGDKLKTIGSEARKDLELMLDAKVFLELWVKVKSGWADDERALRSLGYGED